MVLRGRVVRGSGRGRRIGVPTANLLPPRNRSIPRGVFRVEVLGRALRAPMIGVCNIGTRPTVSGGSGRRLIEVHIPGFRGRLYGRTLSVRILSRIRSEKRFPSLGALKAQIRKDIRKALGTGF